MSPHLTALFYFDGETATFLRKKCIRVTWLEDFLTSKWPGYFTALAHYPKPRFIATATRRRQRENELTECAVLFGWKWRWSLQTWLYASRVGTEGRVLGVRSASVAGRSLARAVRRRGAGRGARMKRRLREFDSRHWAELGWAGLIGAESVSARPVSRWLSSSNTIDCRSPSDRPRAHDDDDDDDVWCWLPHITYKWDALVVCRSPPSHVTVTSRSGLRAITVSTRTELGSCGAPLLAACFAGFLLRLVFLVNWKLYLLSKTLELHEECTVSLWTEFCEYNLYYLLWTLNCCLKWNELGWLELY